MPLASEEQVPKPLTYTLMYHFLWCVLFLLSAGALAGVFLAAGQPLGVALGAPLPLVFFGLLAGLGALITYVVRVQVLLGQASRESAFRWSAISSWGVIVLAPRGLAPLALRLRSPGAGRCRRRSPAWWCRWS